LPTANARKPITGSKDADSRLVYFKIKKQRICPLNFLSSPDDVIQKTHDLPQLCRPPKKRSNPKLPSVFLIDMTKTFRIFRGFVKLCTAIGWRVLAGYVPAKKPRKVSPIIPEGMNWALSFLALTPCHVCLKAFYA